jgi:Phage integrase central domain/Arm DNA-binding domain
MPKLTVLQLRNSKGKCRLADGGGLYFDVTSSGLKRWIYRFRIDGKGNMFVIGHYPEMSLEQARQGHREAKALVKEGANPSKARIKKKQAVIDQEQKTRFDKTRTFEYVALEWIVHQRGRWSKVHSDAVLKSLQNNVFKSLGDQPVDTITPPQILKILRTVEARGSLEIARKVLQRTRRLSENALSPKLFGFSKK